MNDQRTRPALRIGAVLALVAATAAVYAQVAGHQFLIYDDAQYVSKNSHVTAGLTIEGLRYAFTTGTMGNWHPLTWLSLMLDCQLFGVSAGPILLVNLLLHLVSTVLLLLVLERATGELGKSAVVAGLFALHPLHVESVAWIAERKDVLSTLFWMLAMGAYVLYAERPGRGRYLGAVLFFALGLLSKPMLVTFPFVLLLLDVWPLRRLAWPPGSRAHGKTGTDSVRQGASEGRPRRGQASLKTSDASTKASEPNMKASGSTGPLEKRGTIGPRGERADRLAREELERTGPGWGPSGYQPAGGGTIRVGEHAAGREGLQSLIVEKVPFFALAAVSSVLAFYAQRATGVVASTDLLPIGVRVANAVVSYALYLVKAVWPAGLAVVYPHLGMPPVWRIAGAAALLLVVSAVVFRAAPGRPYVAVGWLWYLGTLVPVIGLVQVGAQALADRYTYVPLVGIFVMIAWTVPDLLPRFPHREKALAAAACLVLAACAARTWTQVGYWRNNMTLFRHALEVTTSNVIAHNDLGIALDEQGRREEAIEQFEAALRIKPDHVQTNNNLAVALAKQGRIDEAIRRYSVSLAIDPRRAETHFNFANALREAGRWDEAAEHFAEAARLRPAFAEARYNLGGVRLRQGRLDEAARELEEALRIDPGHAEARRSLEAVRSRRKEGARPK